MSMPATTLFTAALLIIVGVGGYVLGDAKSVTALIPAFAGILLGLFGLLAKKESRRMHMMHAAVTLALLLAIATISRGGLWKLAQWGELEEGKHLVVASLSATAAISLVFVVLCVRSFIAARRAREA